MPSAYLQTAELANYGLPASTTAAQIASASALVDSYLARPEGLQWSPDAAGLPCYMAALSPKLSLKTTAAIAAGANVPLPLQMPASMLASVNVGDVLIIDRATADKVEGCVVASVGQGGIVLQSVANAHDQAATVDFGLVIAEQRSMPAKRQITRVVNTPIVRVHSVVGQYRYGRRSQQSAGAFFDAQFLDLIAGVGGPLPWNLVDLSAINVSPETGELWIPLGIFLGEYSDARTNYVAGWPQDALPPIIKYATALAIQNATALQGVAGGAKMMKAGDTMIQKFGDTVLDADTRAQLALYRAKVFA